MRILSLLIFFVSLILINKQTDSPHGSNFKISCKTCHSPKGWQLDKEIYSFDHNTTKLPLVGQHSQINCRQCHKTLVFAAAKNVCNECHIDIHQATVGGDCSRCHTPASWLVNNINEIHQTSRFPLLGAHRTADCYQCHKSESLARFDVAGVNCIDCHRENYLATTNPNHIQSGMSEDCSFCHQINSFKWAGAGFNHDAFPLVQGHSAVRCTDCHTTGSYSDAKPDCYSCHQQDFLGTKTPDHNASKFSTSCGNCHTLISGWKPTTFNHSKFPLTLGHSGPACLDCHKNGNYSTTPTDCNSCHQQNYLATTNPNHTASGYSTACQSCHSINPGWKPATFNHNKFPLTLGHSGPACTDCHQGGNYASTPTDCYACHQGDYNSSTNPNHKSLAFSVTCTLCHTTNPDWKPASYTQHDTQFPIYSGKHKGEWSDCSECHTNSANYTVFNCINCHSNAHTGKNYTSAQCYSCHPRGTED